MNGTIKFYNFKKRFGFISGEDGKDYFVHETGVIDKRGIKDGVAVTFEVEDGEKGPKAVNVNLV
ncbi:MAG: cold shock domain-containing protein [Candidatus ainarchaeum sp.]|nr:cold shock domain-containing protein [Candidatus ainarchaeum sp.]MDD3975545.1 cold shock domain-containing protein [Candidatus ainarchaeum sp.]